MAQPTLSGSCHCGNISYKSTSPATHLDYCYCLTCQKVSGAPFMAWMGIPKASLEWEIKQKPFYWRTPIGDYNVNVSERTCCGSCSSNMILQYALYPDKTHVAASSISHSDFDMPKVGCHIWTKHVPTWHSIAADGVPRYEEFDPVFDSRLKEYLNRKSDQ